MAIWFDLDKVSLTNRFSTPPRFTSNIQCTRIQTVCRVV